MEPQPIASPSSDLTNIIPGRTTRCTYLLEENAGVAEVVVDPASVEDIRATEDEEGAGTYGEPV